MPFLDFMIALGFTVFGIGIYALGFWMGRGYQKFRDHA